MKTTNENANDGTNDARDQMLEEIAKKHLHVETLKTRSSDSLDFYDTAVWGMRDALIAAYNAGLAKGAIDAVTEARRLVG